MFPNIVVTATGRNHLQLHPLFSFQFFLLQIVCGFPVILWKTLQSLLSSHSVSEKMAVSFPRISWWMWGGKDKEPVSNGSSLNSTPDWGLGLREHDTVKFPSVKRADVTSSSRKVKRKWQSREERRIDREYDVVLVPSDGVCLSGSESDDSDWSIGWLEPHAPDFLSDDETDRTFAVLVPCYRHGCKELVEDPNDHLLSAIKNLRNEYSAGKSGCICEFNFPLFFFFYT